MAAMPPERFEMSDYKFRALSVINIDILGRSLEVRMDMDTPQAKHAFMTLAEDCRLNELGEWMAELGYTITEIEEQAA